MNRSQFRIGSFFPPSRKSLRIRQRSQSFLFIEQRDSISRMHKDPIAGPGIGLERQRCRTPDAANLHDRVLTTVMRDTREYCQAHVSGTSRAIKTAGNVPPATLII